jgi:phosphatidylserine/phosphatidylglycerophosphate/cardiolipin synthase-like enzyme
VEAASPECAPRLARLLGPPRRAAQWCGPILPCPDGGLFLPHGGATEAVVRELAAAKTQILVQAYAFPSAPIAHALVEAHKRGVKVLVVLDKSNQTARSSAATFLTNAGITTVIDDRHAIAHSRVMVIDSATILTGSFNLTTAAKEKNAENLPVIKEAYELVRIYETNIGTHAAHSRPYTRQNTAAAAVKSPQPVKTSGVMQGNPQSKIYHLLGCPGYKSRTPTTVITFLTEDAAQQAGYRKAKNCP